MEFNSVLNGSLNEAYYWLLDKLSRTYTRKILIESIDLLWKLWPYLVLGIILTTLVKMYLSKGRMASFFSGKTGSVSILAAACIGVAAPLGSYAVIPISAGLFAAGVPFPPLMALMIASPLIDPNLFLLTSGAMGVEMAIARTVSAFVLGITAGYASQRLIRRKPEWFSVLLRDNKAFSIEKITANPGRRNLKSFLRELYRMTRYISKYFFLAILLAAMIKILVNPAYILRIFSRNEFMAVLSTTIAGVPFYVCGGAAIPVVQTLAELGLSKGAVLAFFISGPITKISNLVIMNAAFKSVVLVNYLAIGIGGALILGLIYNILP